MTVGEAVRGPGNWTGVGRGEGGGAVRTGLVTRGLKGGQVGEAGGGGGWAGRAGMVSRSSVTAWQCRPGILTGVREVSIKSGCPGREREEGEGHRTTNSLSSNSFPLYTCSTRSEESQNLMLYIASDNTYMQQLRLAIQIQQVCRQL